MVNVILFVLSWVVVFGLIIVGKNEGLVDSSGMIWLVVLGLALSVASLAYGRKEESEEEDEEE